MDAAPFLVVIHQAGHRPAFYPRHGTWTTDPFAAWRYTERADADAAARRFGERCAVVSWAEAIRLALAFADSRQVALPTA